MTPTPPPPWTAREIAEDGLQQIALRIWPNVGASPDSAIMRLGVPIIERVIEAALLSTEGQTPTSPTSPAREIADQVVKELWPRPRPLCRDCADEDGVCPTTGEACDPWRIIEAALLAFGATQQEELERVRGELAEASKIVSGVLLGQDTVRDELYRCVEATEAELERLRGELEELRAKYEGLEPSEIINGYKNLAESSLARARADAIGLRKAAIACQPVIKALIDAEYNVETWGLHGRLKALDAALSSRPVEAGTTEERKWPQREEGVAAILADYSAFISARPELTSLLYDIDMLPEQCVTRPGAVRLAGLCEVWKRMEKAEASPPLSGSPEDGEEGR